MLDGHRYIEDDGEKKWLYNGRLHREDGPAIICEDGSEFWYLHGKYHRTNGPAVIFSNGNTFWFIDDKMISSKKMYQTILDLSDEDILLLILKYGEIR